jgi:hypothetical protein
MKRNNLSHMNQPKGNHGWERTSQRVTPPSVTPPPAGSGFTRNERFHACLTLTGLEWSQRTAAATIERDGAHIESHAIRQGQRQRTTASVFIPSCGSRRAAASAVTEKMTAAVGCSVAVVDMRLKQPIETLHVWVHASV